MVWLRKLRSGGNSSILLAQPTRAAQPTRDPYAMDVDRINLSPSERVEHMWNHKCFICHKDGCHSSKHKGFHGKKGKLPQQGAWPPWRTTKTRDIEGDLWINNFMKQHGISTEQALNLMGNYYSHNKPATTWDGITEEESVNEIIQGFKWEGRISVFTSHRHSVCTCNNVCWSNHYSCDSLQDGKWKNHWDHCSDWQWGNNLLYQLPLSLEDEVAAGETPPAYVCPKCWQNQQFWRNDSPSSQTPSQDQWEKHYANLLHTKPRKTEQHYSRVSLVDKEQPKNRLDH